MYKKYHQELLEVTRQRSLELKQDLFYQQDLSYLNTDSSVSLKHSHNSRSRGDDLSEGEGRGSVLHLGCGTIFGGRDVHSGAICRTLFASALPDDWHHDDTTCSVGAKHAHASRLHFLGNAARLSARATRFRSFKETWVSVLRWVVCAASCALAVRHVLPRSTSGCWVLVNFRELDAFTSRI